MNAEPIDYQINPNASWPHKFKLQGPTQTHPPSSPSSLIHQILFPLLFPLVGCPTGTSLPPRECVTSSSDNPPINRYSTLSRVLTLLELYLKSLLSSVGVAFLGPNMREYTAALYIPLLFFDACLENNFWLMWLCFFSVNVLLMPPPPLCLSPPPRYRNVNLCIWLIWFWAYRLSMLQLSPSPPSVTSTVPACSSLMAWRKTSLCYLGLTSPHATVSEMKSRRIIFMSCRRSFRVHAGYATLRSIKWRFFQSSCCLRELWSRETSYILAS